MNHLETPVQYVKGVGPYFAGLLSHRGIEAVGDLLYHIPSRYIDRREVSAIAAVPIGKNRTVIGCVVTSGISWLGRKRKKIFEVIIKDDSGVLSGKWFNFHEKYMTGQFSVGTTLLFSGEVTEYGGVRQFIHPEVEILKSHEEEQFEIGGRIIPIYPSTEGLTQRFLRKIVKAAWEKYAEALLTLIPPLLREKYNLMESKEALTVLHFPSHETDPALLNSRRSAPHRTLIFEEFFLLELALNLKKAENHHKEGIRFQWSEEKMGELFKILPFTLTGAQKRVVSEIREDMMRPVPMNRLLQGDVGSGKTIVAFIAALQAAGNGYQVAFMAPTEILAEQHFTTLSPYGEKLGIKTALVTSSVKGALRETVYGEIQSGSIPLIFGTHALIQEELKFSNLGLVIIDEQHRFGVIQRSALHQKGTEPDRLVMTATPIPRTLAITLYGDLDLSVINELPAGRKPITTKIYRESERKKLYEGMRKELEKGHQIYVVYPLIEESEKIDLKNATEMSEVLRGLFEPKFKVRLLHGRMKGEEKESVMAGFKKGEIQILAATSVVEVGVDVPNATVMIVEHAERFGLSQLHQLRGRVGRSPLQSYCVLMTRWRLSEEARRRLAIMEETTDGFKIAEEDLLIRGPGEFMGTRQSGLPQFFIADIVQDQEILELARSAAVEMDLAAFPELKTAVLRKWKSRLSLTEA